jgi:hypothetical protein
MSKNTNLSFLTDYITADITNGRIGINTPSPTVAFDVTGVAKFSSTVSMGGDVSINSAITTYAKLNIKQTASTDYSGIAIYSNNGTETFLGLGNTGSVCSINANYGGSGAYVPLIFSTGGNERMRITSAGNVGIGTSSPSQKLEVVGTTHLISTAGNITGVNIIPGNVTNTYQTIGESNNATVRFHTNIVTGWANWDNWGSSYMDFKVESKPSGTGDQSFTAMQIRPTGDIRMSILTGSGSRAVMADANGQLSASVSDITLKENIKPIGYGLKEIMQMNPVWFDFVDGYKNYGEGRQNGNIAQEIAEIIPEAVFTTPQTGKMGINYEQLHAVYIKAIQELKAEIETLKNK